MLEPLFAGTPFGLAEENLQSRIRGTLLMALSNKFGALVLTTGNKSEMSTGYCTLYGDMVGALAVIGDVMKTRVYALEPVCESRARGDSVGDDREAAFGGAAAGAADTDSLPPYEVLDPILEAYVERYCSAEQIAAEQGLTWAGAAVLTAGGAERVQAAAGGSGVEGDDKVVRNGATVSHCGQGSGVIEVLRADKRRRRIGFFEDFIFDLAGLATALSVTVAGCPTERERRAIGPGTPSASSTEACGPAAVAEAWVRRRKAGPFPPVNQKYFTRTSPTVVTVNAYSEDAVGV